MAVADGFGDVAFQDGLGAGQVGDGARHAQYAGEGAGGHSVAVHGVLEAVECALVGPGVPAQLAGVHLRVAVHSLLVAEAFGLALAGGDDARTDDGRGLAGLAGGEGVDFHGEGLDVQVYAVEQRAGEALEVALHVAGGAGARPCGVVVVAARAGVHAGHEHEGSGVGDGVRGPGDGDSPVLDGLPQHFQDGPRELREFVEV